MMKRLLYAAVVGISLAVLFLATQSIAAQSFQSQAYGGALAYGNVYGFNMYDELIPLEWVPVTAKTNQYSFVAYTGDGGMYEMFLPPGDYLFTIETPGYKTYNMSASLPEGSSVVLNFYLEQSNVPIPEFPVQMSSIIFVVAVTAVLLAVRTAKRKNSVKS